MKPPGYGFGYATLDDALGAATNNDLVDELCDRGYLCVPFMDWNDEGVIDLIFDGILRLLADDEADDCAKLVEAAKKHPTIGLVLTHRAKGPSEAEGCMQ